MSKSSSSKKIEKEFKDLRKNLLDLTLRNQLLNFKDRNQTLNISDQSPSNVYNFLVLQNKSMRFVSTGKAEDEKESHSIFNIRKPKFTHDDNKLDVDLTPNQLQKRLFYINNQSKTMLEEQGYNILYMAIGFLKWIDRSKPKKINLAPLILIPVTMERKQIGNNFYLHWSGEDIQTNISLKTKLSEDGIEIPDFEGGNYVEAPERYMKKVSEAVSHMKKWEVTDKVALGFFSFTKFIMYNDLNPESWKDGVDLTNHPLIQAIFDPSVNDQEGFNEADIDKKVNYRDMYQVLDADSSQIAVIEDVKAGRNLVVEGPPGTGKSQTIVNLIAELIADGKTVLFVAEKMAALEVVKNRLSSVGLGKYVLELHSHKTRRKKFLKELQKSANVRSTKDLNIDRTIRKLETLKVQLDDYAEIIHKPLYAVQLSPYDLYGKKEYAEEYFSKQGKILPLVRFDHPEDLTMKDLDDIVISLENLAELHGTINQENPWSYCSPDSLLPSDLREIELLITDSSAALDDFKIEAEIAEETYGIKEPVNLESYNKTIESLNFLDGEYPIVDKNLLQSSVWNSPKEGLKLIEDLEKYQKSAKVLDKFHKEILNEDIDGLIREFEEASHKKFSFFSKSPKKDVEEYYIGKVPRDSTVISDLKEINEFKSQKARILSEEDLGRGYFSGEWNLNQNPDELKKIYSWMFEFKQLCNEGIFTEKIYDYITNDFKTAAIKESLSDFIDKGENFKKQLNKLQSKLKPNTRLIFHKDADKVSFDDWVKQFNKWKGHLSSLHLWSQYLKSKQDCMDSEAKLFIDTIEKRNIHRDDVKALVSGNFADSLLNIVFEENEELNSFVGELHENKIKDFRDLDKKILELNRKRVFNKLNKNVPKIYGGASNEEARILAGEFTRKSGHLTVRSLLEKAGGIIKQIKPVFMMSPLSIAQYLDPTNPKLQFDVVIFDEASQVKPEDALGAFMRAKTAVVMGDTQQLPPTSFFDQIIGGESHDEVAGALDMESILHLCKLSFPVKMLKWHYRSRHESLINVSNKEFYDNNLLVYPSPSHDDPELGLKFKYCPNTVYERGEGSYNHGEAKEVVKAIFEHFEKYGDSKSLGVGTFSVAQRNAILEELEVERNKHPELEPLFSENREDRFFVKNLETIQGDERDVIFISVGYGFDQDRKMSLNFGPLNQDGGERRLNVLVTRAKEKCVVFSNFRSSDMHLTANPPFGVRALREFLEYAENLTMGNIPSNDDTIEPFEEAVYTFLTEKGYNVDKHVGCAGFRVDLAIIDDNNPGRYILGITTDGKMYASSKVARDRDRLREQVLDGLGWKIYHLWSTDWYRNREVSKERLIERIEQAKIDTIKEDEKRLEEERKFQERMEAEKQRRLEELQKAEEEEKRLEEEKNRETTDDFKEVSSEDDNKEDSVKANDNSKENIDKEESRSMELINQFSKDKNKSDDDHIPVKSGGNDKKSSSDDYISVDTSNDTSNDDHFSVESRGNDKKSSNDDYISVDTNNGSSNSDYISVEDYSPRDNDDYISESEFDADSGLEDVISIDDEIINQIKSEADEELLKRSGADSFTSSSLNKVNDIVEKFSKSSEDKVNQIMDKRKNNDKDNIIISFIGSRLSSDKDKEDNGYITVEDNPSNGNEDDGYITVEDKASNEYNNNYINPEDNNNEDNDYISIEDSSLDEESDEVDYNDNDEVVITSDDEYEYLEVPADRELKDDEEFIEFIPNDKDIKNKDIKDKFDEYVGFDFDDSLEKTRDNKDSNQKDSDNNETTNRKDVDDKGKIPKARFRKKFHEETSNSDDEDELDQVISDIIKSENYDSQEASPLNTYGEISETKPAVNDNSDLNILNDEKLNSNKEESNVNSKNTHENHNNQKEYPVEVDESSNTYDDFYSISDINNPLKKNNIYYQPKNTKSESILDKASKFIKEIEYINNSLNEIENPTPPEKVHVIDRLSDTQYDDVESEDNQENIYGEYISDSNNRLNEEYITDTTVIDSDDLDIYVREFNKNSNYRSSNDLTGNTNYTNSNNKNTHDNKESINLDDDTLEEFIETVDKDYQKEEKERKNSENSLKSFDNRTLPSKGKTMKSYIKPYNTVSDLGLKSPEDVYDKSISYLAETISHIADVEGPVHKNIVIKRIKDQSGIKRAGSKLKSVVNDSIKYGEEKSLFTVIDDFIYSSNNTEITVRKREKPNIDYISNDEIGSNIKLVLIFKEHLKTEKLTKTVARNFGFKSTSKKTAKRIDSVIDLMLAKGIIENVEGEIQLK